MAIFYSFEYSNMSEDLEEKNAKFLSYWAEKRSNKRKFYLQFVLGWGVIGGNLAYLLSINFKPDQFQLVQYMLYVIFWVLGGLLWAHLQFKAQEKHYQKLKKPS